MRKYALPAAGILAVAAAVALLSGSVPIFAALGVLAVAAAAAYEAPQTRKCAAFVQSRTVIPLPVSQFASRTAGGPSGFAGFAATAAARRRQPVTAATAAPRTMMAATAAPRSAAATAAVPAVAATAAAGGSPMGDPSPDAVGTGGGRRVRFA